MTSIVLDAHKRVVMGKKVKKLRREGIVPAIVYGPRSEPIAIQLDRRELRQALYKAGGTQLIDLHIEDENVTVLARDVQRDVLRGELMHVDFYRVALDRPIRAEIPVIVINEPEIVSTGGAMVHHVLTSIEVETLPANLPPQIEIDISELTEVGDSILVQDIDLGSSITIHADPEEAIVRLAHVRLAVEEVEEMVEAVSEAGEVEVLSERREENEE